MQRRRTAEAERLLRADVDRLQVGFRDVRAAHDVRRQQHDDVGLRDLFVVAREQLLQHRHVNGAGESLQRSRSSSRSRPASRFDSPSRSRSRVLTLRDAERRDVHAADVDVRAARAVLDVQVEQDVVLERHARRHLDVDADVL